MNGVSAYLFNQKSHEVGNLFRIFNLAEFYKIRFCVHEIYHSNEVIELNKETNFELVLLIKFSQFYRSKIKCVLFIL